MARNHQERQETRLALLRALQVNCDRPNKELAHDIHVDASSLSRLRARLEKEGYIRCYKAVLDPVKFNLTTAAYVKLALIETDAVHVNSTIYFLLQQPEIQEIHSIEGEYDMFIKIRVRAPDEVLNFTLQRMVPEHNIKDTIIMIILSTYKETSEIMI